MRELSGKYLKSSSSKAFVLSTLSCKLSETTQRSFDAVSWHLLLLGGVKAGVDKAYSLYLKYITFCTFKPKCNHRQWTFLLITFRLYVVWMLLIFRSFWPWDVITYRGAAACTGPVSYSYGSWTGGMTDRENPNCWGKNQTHCSGRHVQNSAEENVWVRAEKGGPR